MELLSMGLALHCRFENSPNAVHRRHTNGGGLNVEYGALVSDSRTERGQPCLAGRTGAAQMPLATLQKDDLAVLAGNRSDESHFAGGVVLNVADHSARFSHDFDIFHELAEEVTRASTHDVESLRRAGFQ